MTDPRSAGAKAADERAARLAEALRANLRRRKGQARERDADGTPPRDEGGSEQA